MRTVLVEVHHHLDLLVGVALSHRDDHRTQEFRAGLKADADRPEAVAGRDVHAVHVRDARPLVAAREHDGPVGHVLPGVRDDDRRAG